MGVLLSREFRHIIRIADQDLKGSDRLVYALANVKGVGVNLANAIVNVLKLDPDQRLGYLTDLEVKKVMEVLQNPAAYGVPAWMLNRQKDLESGEHKHLIGSELALRVRQDVDFMKKIRCWKGVRHSLGLKVRGQRTRTTGRTGQTVGVGKKAGKAKRPAPS